MANTISDKLTYLEGTKSAIKDAIVAKGVAVSDSDTFRSYADKIGQISGGGGDKLDIVKAGLKFAYCNMGWQQFNSLNWTIPSDGERDLSNLFFNSNLANSIIDFAPKMDTSLSYKAENMFNNANIHQILLPQDVQFEKINAIFASFISPNSTLSDMIFNVDAAVESTSSGQWFYGSYPHLTGTLTINIKNFDSTVVYLSLIFGYFYGSSIFDRIVINTDSTNTSINLQYWFQDLIGVNHIPEFDLSSINNQDLSQFIAYSEQPNIISMGGIINLRSTINLQYLLNLNTESVDNILNKAADLVGEVSQTITFAADVYNALTEEQKSLAASKNWTLASA